MKLTGYGEIVGDAYDIRQQTIRKYVQEQLIVLDGKEGHAIALAHSSLPVPLPSGGVACGNAF